MALADLSQHEVSVTCLPVPQLRDLCTYMGQHATFKNSNTIQCSSRMICDKNIRGVINVMMLVRLVMFVRLEWLERQG